MGPTFHRLADMISERFRMLPFDREAALLAARMDEALRERGEEVPVVDLFIAASAVVWGDSAVITANERHFRRLHEFGLTVLTA